MDQKYRERVTRELYEALWQAQGALGDAAVAEIVKHAIPTLELPQEEEINF